jgi:hypothetical protein
MATNSALRATELDELLRVILAASRGLVALANRLLVAVVRHNGLTR